MATDRRGEVWLVDLGYVAKVRAALVISTPSLDDDRALVALVPHTTSPRGTHFEVPSNERYLKPGAFNAQNIVTVAEAKLLRRLGRLSSDNFDTVIRAVSTWLGIALHP